MRKRELTDEQRYEHRIEAVKKYTATVDRINVLLPKGTCDEIRALGYSCNEFIRNATLEELQKAKKYSK